MPLISPSEAEEMMLRPASLLETESLSFDNSLGRILREDLLADRPFPPFDRVTMDGIAFRFADFEGGALAVQGLHPAGSPNPAPLKPGHCWQIMTGASLPPDCDTVVPYEEIEIHNDSATITGAPEEGIYIHREGSDAPAGALVLSSGTKIGPAHLGMAATIGATEFVVTRLPKITILSTGDELVPPDKTPLPYQLRQSNGLTLAAAVKAWGPAEIQLHHLADDLGSTQAGIEQALAQSDLVILSGGISKGKKDYVRPALENLIGPPVFHGVAQRPGKPLAFWPGVAALPGNPNSTLTTFHRYLVPLLNKMVGTPTPSPINLPLTSPIKQHPTLTQFLPAQLTPDGKAQALTPQNSGDFLTAMSGTGYLEIPPGNAELQLGSYR